MKPIIEVSHLTKEYQLGHITSLKENVLNTFRRLGRKPVQKRENFKALDDVNFTIEQGEVVGIIGHNGAGKSTLLKHLANISKPTKGKVIVRGSIAPLIEVGAGVNPEMTGRENIFLNGAILGIPKKIIQQKLDEIIEFSELEQFIDTPVKRYSSGMTVKLGFSIATSLDADILIIDEVLAVGDLAFQRKCFDKMEDLINRQGKTVLLVSHNIRQVERLCTRVILLNHGSVLRDDQPTMVCNAFYQLMDGQIAEQARKAIVSAGIKRVERTGEVDLLDISIHDKHGNQTEAIMHGEDVTFVLRYKATDTLKKNVIFGVGIHTNDFLYLADKDTEDDGLITQDIQPGIFTVRCKVRNFPLLQGVYSLRLGVAVGPVYRIAYYAEGVHPFEVKGQQKLRPQGFIALDTDWTIIPSSEFVSTL
jgi:ABC-type polysaccharide/polyol phosphate transport system ATPase subunit